MFRRLVVAVVMLLLLSAVASAQWLRVPNPKTPRTSDGRPNMTAPAPRVADGKPDLGGLWNFGPQGPK